MVRWYVNNELESAWNYESKPIDGMAVWCNAEGIVTMCLNISHSRRGRKYKKHSLTYVTHILDSTSMASYLKRKINSHYTRHRIELSIF
jgi:hypothetical protein